MQKETIENYLKTIYHLSKGNTHVVTNKDLAHRMNVIPATVTEAVKKLHVLKLVEYEKSYGTRLTPQGIKKALLIVRRHRIWETYLAKELGFGWDEVHEIAEELEHVKAISLLKNCFRNWEIHYTIHTVTLFQIKKENCISPSLLNYLKQKKGDRTFSPE
ncbi:MAG: metal-dependent transcriptional regulator [Flavobacteriales bacterium]